MRLFVLLCVTTGCVVIDSGPDGVVTVPCCFADTGKQLSTISVTQSDGLAVSLTSVDGPTACALSMDDQQELGFGGSQLFLRVAASAYSWCPDGIYALNGDACGDEHVDRGCARLRTWAPDGRLVTEEWAVSGAIIVTDDGWNGCSFEIEAVLSGGEVLYGVATTEHMDIWQDDAVCATM